MTDREKSEITCAEINENHTHTTDNADQKKAYIKHKKRKLLLSSLSYLGFAIFLFAFYFFLVFLRHGFGTTKALLVVGGISMIFESGKLFIEYIKPVKEDNVKNDAEEP